MTLATLQLPLYRLPDEIGAFFALIQNGVDAIKRALRKARRGLLVVDLFPAHASKIDDITKCYKAHFCGYHLLTFSGKVISSIPSERRRAMTYFTQIDPTNTRRFAGPEGQVLAIYDQTRAYTLYAEIGSVDGGKSVCFVSAPRSYFSDEVSEINNGGWY